MRAAHLHPADSSDYPAVRRVSPPCGPSASTTWRRAPVPPLARPRAHPGGQHRHAAEPAPRPGNSDLAPARPRGGPADEYGLCPLRSCPSPRRPLRPLNPYAVSKIAQDYLGAQYHLARGSTWCGRSPLPPSGPSWRPISLADRPHEAGAPSPSSGWGTSRRGGFTDVRRGARWLALERGGRGRTTSAAPAPRHPEILDGPCPSPARVGGGGPGRIRPSDTPEIVCDACSLRGHRLATAPTLEEPCATCRRVAGIVRREPWITTTRQGGQGQESADHRHHRPGWLVPPSSSWKRAMRCSAWCAARAPRGSTASSTSWTASPSCRGPLTSVDHQPHPRMPAHRGVQPRRAVLVPTSAQPVLTAEFTALGVTRTLTPCAW